MAGLPVASHPRRAEIDALIDQGVMPAELAERFPECTREQFKSYRRRRLAPGAADAPATATEVHVAGDDIDEQLAEAREIIERARAQGLHVSQARIERGGSEWDAQLKGGSLTELESKRRKAIITVRADEVAPVEDPADLLDVEQLSRRLRRRLPKAAQDGAGRWLVVVLADWQVGKGEGGGTPAFVERMRSLAVSMRERIRDARRCGRPYSGVAFLGLGDLVEQCSGHYAMQAFGVDLDRRSQINLAADTVVTLVDVVVDERVPDILVAAVPGNHGENRNSSGKAFTTWSDNDDLLLFDGVERAFKLAGDRYAHVRFAMPVEEDTPLDPKDPLVLVVDIGDVAVGLTHGHAKKGSGHAAPKMEDWWRRQCMGNRPVARAQILFSGHLHHYICSEATGRTFFQSPALDGGSYWYTASSGASSHPGVLMVDVGVVCGPRGWAHPDVAPCLPLEEAA